MAKVITNFQGNFFPKVNLVIEQGEQESSPFNCAGLVLAGILIPSVFTGTALTFMVGDSEEGFSAKGQAVFTGTTTDGDTIEINGVEITFVDADPADFEVLIGATAAETAENLFNFLDASEDDDLNACTYELFGTAIMVTAVEPGTAGNALTFVKSSTEITLTPAGGTLAGGGFRALYDAANSLVSMTVAQDRCYAIDPKNFQGVYFLKIKSGSVELARRTLVCSLKGL